MNQISLYQKYLLIALGGFVGTFLRLVVLQLWPATESEIPWSTFFENISGAFLLGLLLTVVAAKGSEKSRLFFGSGVFGSYTTFSALSIDLLFLLEQSFLLFIFYISLSISLGIAAVIAGIICGNRFLSSQGGSDAG